MLRIKHITLKAMIHFTNHYSCICKKSHMSKNVVPKNLIWINCSLIVGTYHSVRFDTIINITIVSVKLLLPVQTNSF